MKKAIVWILFLSLALTLFGCSRQKPQVPMSFYYRRAEFDYEDVSGIIAPEIRETASAAGDLDAILSLYFLGPQNSDLESPFPRGSGILSHETTEDTLILTMNPEFSVLSGVELTIAYACIAKTVLPMVPVEQIRFQTGERALTLSVEDLMLYDNSLDQSRAEFTLYYTDRQQRYLIGETVSVNLATEDDLVTFLLQRLMTAPEDSILLSAIPPNTQLLGYSIDDGICTLNFSEDFERSGWGRREAQRLTLLSIVNTLTQLDQIEKVEFSIDGNLLVQYRQLSISAPFVPEETAIGPVRTGMNEFDATLYLANGPEQYLAPVPIPLRQTGGFSQAELVVTALLNYSNTNGYYSRIPEGTQLQGLNVRSGVCYIDLSEEFLSSTDHLVLSVHSIAASVCALDGIDRVQITVDGFNPRGEYAALFEILTPKSDWFL